MKDDDLIPNIIELDISYQILEITSRRKIYSGNNSNVWHLVSSENDYILKVYPANANDKRERLIVESEFVSFLGEYNIANTPRLIHSNRMLGYAIYTKLPGSKVGIYSINEWLHNLDLLYNYFGLIKRCFCNPLSYSIKYSMK